MRNGKYFESEAYGISGTGAGYSKISLSIIIGFNSKTSEISIPF
jgi:predicted secreted protein